MINEISKEGMEIGVSLPNFQDWQVRANSFEEIGGYRFDTFNLSGMGSPQRLLGKKDCRVITLTVYDRSDYSAAASRAGCDMILSKPLDLDQFESVVRDFAPHTASVH